MTALDWVLTLSLPVVILALAVESVHTMGATIYVETTIPSFYYEVRTEPEMLARRSWTREWWSISAGRDDLVTSRVNSLLGLYVPELVTHLELLGEEDED